MKNVHAVFGCMFCGICWPVLEDVAGFVFFLECILYACIHTHYWHNNLHSTASTGALLHLWRKCVVCIGGGKLYMYQRWEKNHLANLVTIVIPRFDIRDQAQDTVVESQCSTNWQLVAGVVFIFSGRWTEMVINIQVFGRSTGLAIYG